ncbi:hypothetical protein DFH29DRAFT_613349 [Suillus ampliporus]|nr:hypothetical protein DFH29DRAFT_613349 [Suillus ampliporus]
MTPAPIVALTLVLLMILRLHSRDILSYKIAAQHVHRRLCAPTKNNSQYIIDCSHGCLRNVRAHSSASSVFLNLGFAFYHCIVSSSNLSSLWSSNMFVWTCGEQALVTISK